MDSKELLGLLEAYKLVHAPQKNIAEAACECEDEDEEDEKEMKKGKKSKKEEEDEDEEDDEDIKEATYSAKAARAGKDIGKPGKAFAKIAKEAGKRYGSKERGEKVAGAVLAKLRKEETKVDIFDSILEYLIAEGYANNNQEALKIMANLSEEEILEYRKLAAAAVGGLMALNMMKPGIPSPQHRTPTPERERTELPSSQRSPGSTESLKKRLEDAKKKNDADAAKLDQTIQKDKAQRDASYRR